MMKAWFIALGLTLTAVPALGGTADLGRGARLVSGGAYVLGEQPDGNSIVIHAPRGAIVIDTGRHPAHLDAVMAEAAVGGKPLAAVINTHWHLDHVGGNPAIRRAHPGVPIYATDAIQGALAGFLANYRRQLEEQIAAQPDADKQQPSRAEIALIDSGQALAPDHVVSQSGPLQLAGRRLELHVERNAHTGGDIWIVDPAARLVIAGDLVVLPTPFLDTSCPAHIASALDRIATVRFDRLAPGHGPALTRVEFDRYRAAYANLLACANSAATTQTCAAGWRGDLGSLLPEADHKTADALIGYYMGAILRGPAERTARLCGAS